MAMLNNQRVYLPLKPPFLGDFPASHLVFFTRGFLPKKGWRSACHRVCRFLGCLSFYGLGCLGCLPFPRYTGDLWPTISRRFQRWHLQLFHPIEARLAAVYSWENHRRKWGDFPATMFDGYRVTYPRYHHLMLMMAMTPMFILSDVLSARNPMPVADHGESSLSLGKSTWLTGRFPIYDKSGIKTSTPGFSKIFQGSRRCGKPDNKHHVFTYLFETISIKGNINNIRVGWSFFGHPKPNNKTSTTSTSHVFFGDLPAFSSLDPGNTGRSAEWTPTLVARRAGGVLAMESMGMFHRHIPWVSFFFDLKVDIYSDFIPTLTGGFY